MFSITRSGAVLISLASLLAAAPGPPWEPGKVVFVEQVLVPAKTPDTDCHSIPKGENPPEHCRAAYLRAQRFWRVTVDVGNKRFVVRPYRPPKFVDALSQGGTIYVDPNLKAAQAVEVAIYSSKAVRVRADQGQGIPALVDSQELLAHPEVGAKAELPPPQVPKVTASAPATAPVTKAPVTTAPITSGFKVVLLENGDFRDLEAQEFKTQDIGDGAVLYSFTGDSSEIRAGSNTPVFLVLAENEATSGGNVELSRLQVGKGTRQMAYSVAKSHSASSVPIVVSQASATVRKISMTGPLAPGEYVVLLGNSTRAYLFDVR